MEEMMATRFGVRRKAPPAIKSAPTPTVQIPHVEGWSLEVSEEAYNKLRDERAKLSLDVKEKSKQLEDLIKKEKAMLFLIEDAYRIGKLSKS